MAEPKKKGRSVESKIRIAERRIVSVAESFENLRILVYGKNGVGKTRFAATGPKPLIIDCNEKGTMSIRNMKDVKVFRIETWTDIDFIFWYLQSAKHDRKTVALDTITSLAQLCMRFVLGDESSRDPTQDPFMPSKREWGKVGELMRTVILNFRNLPMHVVFLAQERKGFTDDEDEGTEVFPEVSPSVRSTLTAAVDIIGHQFIKEVVVKQKGGKQKSRPDFRMRIGPHETYVTKDRSDSALPGIIRNPNLGSMIKVLQGGE